MAKATKRAKRTTTKRKTKRATNSRKPKKKAAPRKSPDLLEQLFDKSAAQDWLSFASMQRSRLIREVRDLGEEIVERIADSPVFSQREEMIHDVRAQLETIFDRLNTGDLLHRALDTARMTRTEIMSFLSIPTQKELTKLQRKLNKIETRLVTLNKLKKTSRRPHA